MRAITVALILSLGFVGCSESPPPVNPEPFSLRIEVVDVDGQPVPGLVVGGFNHIPECAFPFPLFCEDPVAALRSKSRPTTTISVCVADSSHVRIVVKDWNDKTVRALVDQVLASGRYHVIWNGLDEDGERKKTGVYKIQMAALGAGGVELFQDEFLAHLFNATDVQQEPIGITSTSGIVETIDILRFPGVLDVPPLQTTTPNQEQGCKFEISNSLSVNMYDPATQKGLGACDALRMTDGANRTTVVWDPTVAANVSSAPASSNNGSAVPVEMERVGAVDTCSLIVYPNPFD